MTGDISYTVDEVSEILRISRFTVYKMIKRGELSAYKVGRKMRIDATELANLKQRTVDAPYVTQPNATFQSSPDNTNGVIICGQDVILDILARYVEKEMRSVRFLRQYAGSIEGLISLYRGEVNLAAVHLWDGDLDEYNIPYLRHYLPGMKCKVVNLVSRMEGFYVAPGNPKQIHDWQDLTRNDVSFVNRERGSGARVLLDEKLRKLNIDSENITGYDHEEMTHLAVASTVARGNADVGLGSERAAMQVRNIEFVPLQKERYDMVILKQYQNLPQFVTIMKILKSKAFQDEIGGLGGYDISQTGKIMAEL